MMMVGCYLQLINSVNLTGGKSSQCIFKVKIIWTKINPFPNVLGWGVLEGNCGDSGHQNKDPLKELFSGPGQLFQRKVSLHRKSLSMCRQFCNSIHQFWKWVTCSFNPVDVSGTDTNICMCITDTVLMIQCCSVVHFILGRFSWFAWVHGLIKSIS